MQLDRTPLKVLTTDPERVQVPSRVTLGQIFSAEAFTTITTTTSISPSLLSPGTRQHAELEPTRKPDAVVCPAHTSLTPRHCPIYGYGSILPRLLQLSPTIPNRHKAFCLPCPGLHKSTSCRQEMLRTHCSPRTLV